LAVAESIGRRAFRARLRFDGSTTEANPGRLSTREARGPREATASRNGAKPIDKRLKVFYHPP
jgi:hypothetical protein